MNYVGLVKPKLLSLPSKLNDLLSCYMVFYQNVRGFYWNIKGDKFVELQAEYEALYSDLLKKADEIAERILVIGELPLHTCDDYRVISKIKGVENVLSAIEGVKSVLGAFEVILRKQADIVKLAANADDHRTVAFISEYIRQQEKEVWIYSAYLNN